MAKPIEKGRLPVIMVDRSMQTSGNELGRRMLIEWKAMWKGETCRIAYSGSDRYYEGPHCDMNYRIMPYDDRDHYESMCIKGKVEFGSEYLDGLGKMEQKEVQLFCTAVEGSNFIVRRFAFIPFAEYLDEEDMTAKMNEVHKLLQENEELKWKILLHPKKLDWRDNKPDWEYIADEMEYYSRYARSCANHEARMKEMED